MIQLEDYLHQRSLTDEQITDFLAIGHKFNRTPAETLLSPPQVCDRIFFIESGIVREYEKISTETEEAAEITTWILGEGHWLYNVDSYVSSNPCAYYLQPLTNVSGYFFYKADVEKLLQQNPTWAYMAYKISEEYIHKMESRNKLHRLKTLPERLEFFEQSQPDLAGKIKGLVLASYLNVHPSQLSRLRANVTRKKRKLPKN